MVQQLASSLYTCTKKYVEATCQETSQYNQKEKGKELKAKQEQNLKTVKATNPFPLYFSSPLTAGAAASTENQTEFAVTLVQIYSISHKAFDLIKAYGQLPGS